MTDLRSRLRLEVPVALLIAMFAVAANVRAQEATIYAALTTDYVFRGVSNSDGHGAVQLGVDLGSDTGLFGGIWASTTDINTGTRHRPREIDYYLGYEWQFEDDWNVSLAANRYTYPTADGSVHYNYTEWSVVAGIRDRTWIEVDYTDSIFGSDQPAFNYEVLASWSLPASLTLTAGIGYFDVSELTGAGYGHWQLGVSRSWSWFTADLRYHDTNNDAARISPPGLADSRIVMTFSALF